MASAGDPMRRDEIRPVKRRVEDDLIVRPGVVGVDIGEKVTGGRPTGHPAIVVAVRRKLPADELPPGQLIPSEIDGVPTDVVEEEYVLHPAVIPLGEEDSDTGADPGAAPPLARTIVGGLSMGPCRPIRLAPPDVPQPGDYTTAGTIGALVTDRGGSGAAMVVTNFHVACVDDAWSVGDTMVQPSRMDGGRCPQDVFGTLARAALSGRVDGAIVELTEVRPHENAIAGIGPVRGEAEAAVGMSVRKRGRTTGLTTGRVASVDATLSVNYGNGLGVRTLRDQIRVVADGERFGDRGDSGAVIVDAARRVVGLYFAGTVDGRVGFANPIAAVLTELDVRLCTRPPHQRAPGLAERAEP
ncbi:hypothetical protein LX15_005420 [Streptoalloteichus tenebrarius]|uniref:Uncharacterized protein n=1 Tax=Streptoalloteichus tenebrarius (strain ATCC 17920 / DSM 40477 / JCM 4838 / CBS 697.72 / NBRC 16177 / NCIMB 11028 / NRRL B-12390 / A12253. 1 / ISP 5477) TaxID=1933 RepID=A0ABT1I1Q3_STRSD|nr:S1 family peptidase [Streptoalloteichus tenebrarius]MCP2261694.1 hypothetical protein [Streptoalloteichus tenebrarius]BFF02404.1 hypothetical protein GCM10020241_40790 [Streptoalloteichus tenebrarius]